MPRQESVSDLDEEDRAIVEKTKEKKKKEKKTLVFEIKLSGDANGQYEYLQLQGDDEGAWRKRPRRLLQISRSSRFLTTNKKRNQIDPEDDYDLDDDFIDDTEANDEFVPDKGSTEHGGFYINISRLKYIELGVTFMAKNNGHQNIA